MSDGNPYLRPAGLLWGRDADEAIEAGHAGRLAGGRIAFTQIDMSLRHEALVSRSWHTYSDFAQSSDSEILRRLELIEHDRPPVGGLDMASPVIMGIINVTPDSFSDGGQAFDADVAIEQGRRLAAAGAAILDIGGESTRPGSDPVSAEAELERVLPVITALAGEGCLVSIDTRKPDVMEAALAAGASIINDVSALTFDPRSSQTAGGLGAPVILMHAQGDPKTMQQNPSYDDVALDVFDALEGWLDRSEADGVKRAHLLADPGIGFGKTFGHNLEILNRATLFHGLGVPLVFGASRKAFIGALTGEKAAGLRVNGSIGAAIGMLSQGVQIVRVHDVRETIEAKTVWQSVLDPDLASL
ncbi:MAG: dihydropteroate synthase [Rhizobiales bacterium]|nr:dihydropteroate synthase [Hyphomicrobiales bacterium]